MWSVGGVARRRPVCLAATGLRPGETGLRALWFAISVYRMLHA